MVFSQDHPTPELRGQPKGIAQVLYERGLWQDRRNDGSKFLLSCPKTKDRSGCDLALNGQCCATALLQSQPDFKKQKGWLQELVEQAGHSVFFSILSFIVSSISLKDFGVLQSITFVRTADTLLMTFAKQSPRLLSRYQQQLLIASINIALELFMHTMMGFSMARKSLRVMHIKIMDKL